MQKSGSYEDDIVDSLMKMSTHDDLLFFTNFGKIYRIKGYNVPEFGRTAKGLPVVNLLNLDKDECVKSMISIDKDKIDEDKNLFMFFVTQNGLVKKTPLDEFKNIRQTGKIAITLKDDDQLVQVKLISDENTIFIAASNGKLIRFHNDDVRPMGRTASGVRGINVDGSKVIGMTTDSEGQYIMTISENGFGKMSKLDDYRESHRGGKGVKTLNTTEKTGNLVALRAVNGDEDLLIMTSVGIVIRLPMEQVKTAGRNTQGVRLIRVAEGSTVSSLEVVEKNEDDNVEDNEAE